MVKIKRVYDKPARTDAYRVLVDRLWPSGVARASLPLAAWLKEAAPGDELPRWFKHDPAKWPEFQRRYGKHGHLSASYAIGRCCGIALARGS